jgi:NADH:ubiquinone oxidoreductase subunit 4 (subunit M)
MTPREILTLAPLAALTLAIGVFPALVLDLLHTPVADFLQSAGAGTTAGLAPRP